MPRNSISIQREFPNAGPYIVAHDVGGVVVAEALEIPMIRRQPAVQHFGDLDRLFAHKQTAGRFLAAVTGIAFDLDPHDHISPILSLTGVRYRKLPTASDLEDGEMGFLIFLEVVALGAMVWLLYKIDNKLQAIGDMIHDATKPEEPRRLTD